VLAAQLRSEQPDVDVVVEDGLEPMGRVVTFLSEDAGRIVFFRFQWVWDVGFWLFARFRPTRRGTQFLLTRLGGRGLLRMITSVGPDVIVSTYPNTTEVLAYLRRTGRLGVPVCSAITDVAALDYWAAPGVDMHLLVHPASADEVRSVAGPQARLQAVYGLTAPAFLQPPDPAGARRRLGLPIAGRIVLVSGGGWGVGDVEGAVDEALGIDDVALVVCLCGRNESLYAQMVARYGADERVRVESFTDRMVEWMAAADVLVHSTGGLTVLEAVMCGLPTISYGWRRGHVRVNNAAFTRLGLAEVVSSREGIAPAIRRAFEGGRTTSDGMHDLPSAASVVFEIASRLSVGR
jgi:UDP-N-acetylglucosamine:LPS N-acetylglucosamine transferase